MLLMFFTERAYHAVPEDEVFKLRSFFGVPNKFFDARMGAQLLNEYLDEKILCDELGFDAVMLNEHHGTPFCMGAVMDVEASILARVTKNVKIVLLGNPTPVVANPAAAGRRAFDDRHDFRRPAGLRVSSAAPAASSFSTMPTPPSTASTSTKLTI